MLLDAIFFTICALVSVTAILCIRWFFMDMDDVSKDIVELRQKQDMTDIRLNKIEGESKKNDYEPPHDKN